MKKCLYCKSEINFGNKKRKFCCNSCRTKFYQEKVGLRKSRNKICKNCDIKFYDSSTQNNMKYCSEKCMSSIYNKKYNQNNKLKNKARNIMNRHKLKNPEFYPNECCICGVNENVEYHHPDYNFPLSVYPLCREHHLELHKNEVVFS